MADVFTKEKRSWVMSQITSKNTLPEKEVFRFLRKNRIYFQRHYKRAPGKPDVALPRRKIAILIDGDFWHGRRFETWRHKMPSEFWVSKIERNIQRDKKNMRALRKSGWRVLRVWASELEGKKKLQTLDKIISFITSTNP